MSLTEGFTPLHLRIPEDGETIGQAVKRVVGEWVDDPSDGFELWPNEIRTEMPDVFGKMTESSVLEMCALIWLLKDGINKNTMKKWFKDSVSKS